MSNSHVFPQAERRMGLGLVLGLVAALVLALLPGVADAKAKKGKGHELTVMTRNLYLGADLSPALNATGIDEAVNAAFQIEQQVHRTQFPIGARGVCWRRRSRSRSPTSSASRRPPGGAPVRTT